MQIQAALDTLSQFVALAKDIAKLPALVLPQYRSAALDLYKICQRLLEANENLSRWLFNFLYFDFRHPDARTRFLDLVRDYKSMKAGPKFRQLKFSCGDISQIYYRDVESKLGKWFSDPHKLEEAQGIFLALTNADAQMVAFTFDSVIGALDEFVKNAESCVDTGAVDKAEELRLQFKVDSQGFAVYLEQFGNDLSELVLLFAQTA